MTDYKVNIGRGFARDKREVTPERGPAKIAPTDFAKWTPSWKKQWQRWHRELAAALKDKDVCQLCNEVGHQATDCEHLVSYTLLLGSLQF